MEKRTIEEVLREHTDSLLLIPGVVGTARGQYAGKPCIKIFVIRKTPRLMKKLPSALEGYVVAVQETGKIHALGSTDQHE